jgi:hypothetical protein
MSWTLTGGVAEYLTAAGDFLRADPVRHTVELTVTAELAAGRLVVPGGGAPVFGWWPPPGGAVTAAAFEPMSPGRARLATEADRGLLLAWLADYAAEAGVPGGDASGVIRELSHGGLTLWEADGRALSLAANHQPAAGVVRVGPVFTPKADRGRGYGGAATADEQRAVDAAGLPARGGPGRAGLRPGYLQLTAMYLSTFWKAEEPFELPRTIDSLICARLPSL